ncbi:MAG TPA: hypothetical protein DIT89_10160 [Planctomycetaceae bacterium]|nr:hypothetical protein [Planctomycetaceae bacterium]
MKKKRSLRRSDRFWAGLALLLVLLQFWWLPGEDGSAADSWSVTVDGKLALYRLMSELFPRVEREATKMLPDENCVLLVLGPDVYPTTQQRQELAAWVRGGGCLVFAPNLSQPQVSIPELGIELEQLVGGTAEGPSVETLVQSAGGLTPGSQTPAGQSPPPTTPGAVPVGAAGESEEPAEVPEVVLQQLSAKSEFSNDTAELWTAAVVGSSSQEQSQPLVTAGGAGVLVREVLSGSGRVLVCATPDLFSNRTLLEKSAVRLVVRLLERAQEHQPVGAQEFWRPTFNSERIVLSEYFNAADSYRSTGILLSPAMRIGTLQLLLVAVLAIWLAFHRFGPTISAETAPRRSLTESAEAIGNLQVRLADGGPLVGSYLAYLQGLLRKRFGAQVRLDDPVALARRTGLEEHVIREELRRATELTTQPRTSVSTAAAMVRWLCRLQNRL